MLTVNILLSLCKNLSPRFDIKQNNFCVQNRQVKLTKISDIGIYVKFVLCRISVYSGFGLNRFHCTGENCFYMAIQEEDCFYMAVTGGKIASIWLLQEERLLLYGCMYTLCTTLLLLLLL